MPDLPAAEIQDLIVSVLETVDFESASVAYCTAVRDMLRVRLPEAAVDVCWRHGPRTPAVLLVTVYYQGLVVSKVVDLP